MADVHLRPGADAPGDLTLLPAGADSGAAPVTYLDVAGGALAVASAGALATLVAPAASAGAGRGWAPPPIYRAPSRPHVVVSKSGGARAALFCGGARQVAYRYVEAPEEELILLLAA